MDAKRSRRYQSSTTVRQFYTDRPAIFSGSLKGRQMMTEHTGLVAKMGDHVAAIESGDAEARKAKDERTALRDTIRGGMESIRSISNLLHVDTNAVDALFPLPARVRDRDLVTSARNVLQHATPLTQEFLDAGLAGNVLTDLPVQVQALETAINQHRTATQTRMGAHAGLAELQTRASKLHKGFDRIFRHGPLQDADTVRIWKDALRVGPSRVVKTAVGPVPKPESSPPSSSKVA
jgi:hypothetical protein